MLELLFSVHEHYQVIFHWQDAFVCRTWCVFLLYSAPVFVWLQMLNSRCMLYWFKMQSFSDIIALGKHCINKRWSWNSAIRGDVVTIWGSAEATPLPLFVPLGGLQVIFHFLAKSDAVGRFKRSSRLGCPDDVHDSCASLLVVVSSPLTEHFWTTDSH